MNYLSHLSREEKIAALQKIAGGEATPEDFKPKDYIFYLYEGPTEGSPGGLYADGRPTSDPTDLANWRQACRNRDIPVTITFFDPVKPPCEYGPDASSEKQKNNDEIS